MRSPTMFHGLRAIRTTCVLRPTSLSSRRPYHTTPAARLPYKDDQDRESISNKAPYGDQQGGEAASRKPESYNPNKTDPGKEKSQDPEDLDISGANQELSKPQGDNARQESRPTSGDKKQRSGGKTGAGKAGKPS